MAAVCGFRGIMLAIMIGLSMLVSGHLVLTADSVSSSAVRVGTPYPLQVPFGLEEPESYIPPDNPLRVEKVELGKLLFFDPRLSANNTVSCASCHIPQLAWTDGQQVSIGIHRQLTTRNGMTIINRLYSKAQLWHGRSPTLEAQALNPLHKPVRMGMPSYEAEVQKLNTIPGYRKLFQQAFQTDVTLDGIAKAIAAFERTVLSGNSPADRFDMGGEENAISHSAKQGLTLFQTKGRCTRCHSGFNFTEELFHNLGIDGTRIRWMSSATRSRRIRTTSARSRHPRFGRFPVQPPTCMTGASLRWKKSSSSTTKAAFRTRTFPI
jgi:cytochrome c peroxidase